LQVHSRSQRKGRRAKGTGKDPSKSRVLNEERGIGTFQPATAKSRNREKRISEGGNGFFV